MAGNGLSFDVTLDMEPPSVTHHDKNIVRFRKRTPTGVKDHFSLADDPDLKRVRERYEILLRTQCRRPPRPLDGPIFAHVTFCFPGPAFEWHIVKPDGDNLVKTALDAAKRVGYIKHDQRVCDLRITKIKGPRSYIRIRAYEIQQQQHPH